MMPNNRICLQKWKDGVVVERNPDDGFVDATQMCEKFNSTLVALGVFTFTPFKLH
jgi:hypothetical protein